MRTRKKKNKIFLRLFSDFFFIRLSKVSIFSTLPAMNENCTSKTTNQNVAASKNTVTEYLALLQNLSIGLYN